ncbi:unnamed protein product [Callosobruchus maculatus]|uniref:TGF-beta family profile domain-containing protein n=1 Tax=Callosobruchus maculatus TaxID=64391 RepID=A0A653C3V4_CALMS|nr:unnamed protein product [Callosobruchus maculatus]
MPEIVPYLSLLEFSDNARCLTTYRYPAACVPFQMPNDIHVSEVSNAELWFRKDEHLMDSHNQTFVVSEVAHWDTNKSFKKSTPVAIQETSLTEDWVRVDVTHVVKNWLDFYDSPVHAFSIVCKTCIKDEFRSPVTSTPDDNRPFLVIYTHIQQRRTMRHKRQRRSAICGGDVNECCKESLYVSFAEIGWGDWIIRPEGYNAYFCKGSCLSPSAITLSGSQHHTILHKMMYGKTSNDGGGRPELTPCCAATQFQPLQLVYMDSNKTVTTKLLSNMIVETCGCM